MTFKDFVRHFKKKYGYEGNFNQVRDMIIDLCDCIAHVVASEGECNIPHFGRFLIGNHPAGQLMVDGKIKKYKASKTMRIHVHGYTRGVLNSEKK